jgi:hypothetical protein
MVTIKIDVEVVEVSVFAGTMDLIPQALLLISV